MPLGPFRRNAVAFGLVEEMLQRLGLPTAEMFGDGEEQPMPEGGQLKPPYAPSDIEKIWPGRTST